MIVDQLTDLVAHLAPGARLMGLDLGTKTIGIALSDASRSVANPFDTIRRSKFQADADALLAFANEHDVGGFILGLPLNMNASEGPRAQSTRAFAANLAKRTEIPIAFWDERLSTIAVERALLEAGQSRRRRARVIDKMAAAYLLQGALDRLG